MLGGPASNFMVEYIMIHYVIRVYASSRHEVAEAAGLISHSFGVEDVDKYIMLFKKVEHRSNDSR